MPTWIALLRGVNVGKGQRVAMADWRALLEGLGCTRVSTLLNSGNAVFDSPARSARRLAEAIAQGLDSRLGVTTPVIVKSSIELEAIVQGNPWATQVQDPSRLLVAFAPDAATLQGLAVIATLTAAPESLSIGPHAAYLHCPGGLLESRAGTALLGRPGRLVTTRNWATTLKLQALASAIAT